MAIPDLIWLSSQCVKALWYKVDDQFVPDWANYVPTLILWLNVASRFPVLRMIGSGPADVYHNFACSP